MKKPNLPQDRDGKQRILKDSRAALEEGGSAFYFSDRAVLLPTKKFIE